MSHILKLYFTFFLNQGRDENIFEMVTKAIEIGYRHFDGAQIYGSEKECGRAINEAIAKGTVIRQDLFVVSKVFLPKVFGIFTVTKTFIIIIILALF